MQSDSNLQKIDKVYSSATQSAMDPTSHQSDPQPEKFEDYQSPLKLQTRSKKVYCKNCLTNQSRGEYDKIDAQKKRQLLSMVLKEGITVSYSAQLLQMKYSTAKTILYQHRHQGKSKKVPSSGHSSFKPIKLNGNEIQNSLVICTSIGKKRMSKYDFYDRFSKVSNLHASP